MIARSIVLMLFCLAMTPPVYPADKPNVLFVAVDDLNDWIGVLGGHPQSKTPNIDGLASRGMLFTRCYCAAPACNPSRAALMTGIRPATSGVYRNPNPWRQAMPDAVTLPQHFMNHGYTGSGAPFQATLPGSGWHHFFNGRLCRERPYYHRATTARSTFQGPFSICTGEPMLAGAPVPSARASTARSMPALGWC